MTKMLENFYDKEKEAKCSAAKEGMKKMRVKLKADKKRKENMRTNLEDVEKEALRTTKERERMKPK